MLYRGRFHVDPNLLSLNGVVYVLIFDNGKMYIGQTSLELGERLRTHCKALNGKPRNKLQKAFTKFATCSCDVLAHGLTIDRLNIMETFFIEIFDSLGNGYNSIPGGRNIRIKPRQKIKTLSEEHKRSIGKGTSKAVINLDTNEVFQSCTQAALSVGGDQRGLSGSIGRGIRFKGYMFSFLNKQVRFRPKQKKSVQNIQTGVIFQSITDAGRSVKRHRLNIHTALRTGGKCAGFNWRRV